MIILYIVVSITGGITTGLWFGVLWAPIGGSGMAIVAAAFLYFWRGLRPGLSSLRDQAPSGLALSGFHPSRGE